MQVNLDNMRRLARKAMKWAQRDLENRAAIDRTTDPLATAYPAPTTGFDLYGLHWVVQLMDSGQLCVTTPIRPGVELLFPFES